jgi:Family of unknown function (DUF5686)/CarboxypepD_reg-like domain
MKRVLKFAFANSLIIVILILLFVGNAQAQFVIKGTITDAVSEEPIPFANIYLKSLNIGASSDIDGNYKIATPYLTDSLFVSYIGYLPMGKRLSEQKEQIINFKLDRSDISLQEIVILPGENPAHVILRKIIENKEQNRKNSLRNYQYEAYSKVELDLYDLKEKFTERKAFEPFKFIFDYIDSTSEDKPYLPVFISESLSDVYYSHEPKVKKEIIKANKMSGVKNESFSQFLNSLQQEIDIYNNWPILLGRSFVSPISDNGLLYYKYYLIDSATIDGHWCYKLNFVPKGKGSLTFTGEMWVADSAYAIKSISMEAAAHVNLNFVEKLSVQQQFTLINQETWMLTKDKITARFKPMEKMSGVIGRKTTSGKDFKVNMPEIPVKFNNKSDIEISENSTVTTDTFWQQHRHESLSKNEAAIYDMVDSLNNNKRFNSYIDIFKTIVTGYKIVGPVELGPILSLVSYNQVEGWRLRAGMRTSNTFSKKVLLGGHIAYGFKDQKVKYGVNGLWLLNKNPRTALGFDYLNDLDLAAASPADIGQENLLTGLIRRDIPIKLMYLHQGSLYYEKELPIGFSSRLKIQHRFLNPVERPGYWDFKYYSGNNDGYRDSIITQIHTTEASIKLRYAHQEKFLSGEFERISLGSKKPIVELTYTGGIKGVIKGGFNYHRLDFRIRDKFSVNPLGTMYYDVFAGKVFGQLPYLLLYVPQGNETYFFNTFAFNMMNEYEFAADQYVSVFLRHYFEGFFFNKIPGIRKLKLRELITLKATMGGMSTANRSANSLNAFIVPNRVPYVEVGAGIENILKLFRVDFIWRLTYRNNPYVGNFGIRAGMSVSF